METIFINLSLINRFFIVDRYVIHLTKTNIERKYNIACLDLTMHHQD